MDHIEPSDDGLFSQHLDQHQPPLNQKESLPPKAEPFVEKKLDVDNPPQPQPSPQPRVDFIQQAGGYFGQQLSGAFNQQPSAGGFGGPDSQHGGFGGGSAFQYGGGAAAELSAGGRHRSDTPDCGTPSGMGMGGGSSFYGARRYQAGFGGFGGPGGYEGGFAGPGAPQGGFGRGGQGGPGGRW